MSSIYYLSDLLPSTLSFLSTYLIITKIINATIIFKGKKHKLLKTICYILFENWLVKQIIINKHIYYTNIYKYYITTILK